MEFWCMNMTVYIQVSYITMSRMKLHHFQSLEATLKLNNINLRYEDKFLQADFKIWEIYFVQIHDQDRGKISCTTPKE